MNSSTSKAEEPRQFRSCVRACKESGVTWSILSITRKVFQQVLSSMSKISRLIFAVFADPSDPRKLSSRNF